MNRFFNIIIMVFLFTASLAMAQFANDIMYQGFIVENSVPFTGIKNLRFVIYTALTGTDEAWHVDIMNVSIMNGVYSCKLSGGMPDLGQVNWNGDKYIEVKELKSGNPVTIGKRVKFAAVPYAINAINAKNSSNAIYADNAGIARNATNALISKNATNAYYSVMAKNSSNSLCTVIKGYPVNVPVSYCAYFKTTSFEIAFDQDPVGVVNGDGNVVISGMCSGLLNLVPGHAYYRNDLDGSIRTNISNVKVGIALNATVLHVDIEKRESETIVLKDQILSSGLVELDCVYRDTVNNRWSKATFINLPEGVLTSLNGKEVTLFGRKLHAGLTAGVQYMNNEGQLTISPSHIKIGKADAAAIYVDIDVQQVTANIDMHKYSITNAKVFSGSNLTIKGLSTFKGGLKACNTYTAQFVTYAMLYNAVQQFIPNVNDSIQVNGSIAWRDNTLSPSVAGISILSHIIRTSASQITLYSTSLCVNSGLWMNTIVPGNTSTGLMIYSPSPDYRTYNITEAYISISW